MRFRALSLLVLASAVSGPGCDDGFEGPGVTFSTHLTLTRESGTPSTTFDQGERIVFVLRVTNGSGLPQRLTLPTSCLVGFVVSDAAGARILFETPDLCSLVLGTMSFEPWETQTFFFTWNQVSDDGIPLGPGIYKAQGRVLKDLPGLWSQVVRFSIL